MAGYSDLLQPFNLFGGQTPTSTANQQAPAAAPTQPAAAPVTPPTAQNAATPPPAPKTPTKAPAITPTYSFMDGSKYTADSKQVAPPTVMTAKPATEDLTNKQAALTQVQTAQAQQTQAITQNQAAAQQAQAAAAAPEQTPPPTSTAANPANDALAAVQRMADATFNSLTAQVQQIMNGTFPLTPSQMAQVQATQNSFAQLKSAQELANQNFVGQIQNAEAASGRNMTAPQIDASLVHAAVSAGIQKIGDIDSQASKAVADLQQGFLDKDYTMINDAYTKASDLFAQKSKTVQQMADNVRTATQDALAAHKQAMDEAQTQLQNQQAAIKFAVDNQITQPYFLVGNTAIDTKTGLPVDLATFQRATGQQVGLPEDQTDFSKLQVVPDKQVQALATKYPDAGITATDTLAQATAKLQSSPIYHKEVYIAPTAYSGGGLNGTSYVPGANPVVDAWVQKINADPTNYKITTVPKNLQSAVIQGLSATGGNNAQDLLLTSQQALADLQNMVNTNQGFSGEVGSKLAFGTLGGIVPHGLPGSSEANFNARLNQVVNDVVLPNLTILHGLGRVTDREFQALQGSLTTLSPNLSEDEFKKELQTVIDKVNAKVQQSTQSGAGQTPAGSVIEYPTGSGNYFNVDAQGNMTPQ